MCNVVRSGSNAFEFYRSIILIRDNITEIVALRFLTPCIVESAYKYVSEICSFYLQGGSEWFVLWSVYVGTLTASETHVIFRP